MNVKHCSGCEDDFYNGHNDLGVETCWLREKATLAPRLLIPIDLRPPYLHLTAKTIPTCYKLKGYVNVTPESIDSRGFWKS